MGVAFLLRLGIWCLRRCFSFTQRLSHGGNSFAQEVNDLVSELRSGVEGTADCIGVSKLMPWAPVRACLNQPKWSLVKAGERRTEKSVLESGVDASCLLSVAFIRLCYRRLERIVLCETEPLANLLRGEPGESKRGTDAEEREDG